MGFRAFIAIDRFPPNPTGIANVMMGRAPVKSYFFIALSPYLKICTYRYYCNRRNVPSRGPSRRDGQRSCARASPMPPDPRARVLLSREELSDESHRSNDSRHNDGKDVEACVFADQYLQHTGGQPRKCTRNHRQVRYNKTGRGHAGTEASS